MSVALEPQDGEAVPSPSDGRPASGRHGTVILANAGFRAIADIGSKIATAALYLVVARKAGASEFGVFVFAMSFAGLCVTLGQFGQEFVLVREVARDHERLDELYSNVMVSRITLAVPPLLIALLIAGAAGMSAHTRLVIALMGIGFVGDSIVQVAFAVFQAFERVALTPVVLVTQRWLTTIAALAVLYAGGGIVGVAALYCAGTVLAVLLSTFLLRRRVARPRLRFDLAGTFAVTRAGLPIGLGIIALTMLGRIDMSLLAAFKPATEVGRYGAAYRLLETTAFVTWSVNVAVLPSMARLSPVSSPPVGAIYQRAMKLVLTITLPMAVGAAILAGPIVALLYGAQYHKAGLALVLLAPAITLAPVSALSSQMLYAQDAGRIVPIVYTAVLVENVVYNVLVIPHFSLYGAAAGTSISELLVAMLLFRACRPLIGRLEIRRLLAGSVIGSAVAAAAMAVLHADVWAAVAAGAVAYLVIVALHEHLVFPEDFSVARDLVLRIAGRRAEPSAG